MSNPNTNEKSSPGQPGHNSEGQVVARYTLDVECMTTADGRKKCGITNVIIHRPEGHAGSDEQPSAPVRADTEQVASQKERPEEPAKKDSSCDFCDVLENMAAEFTNTAAKEDTEAAGTTARDDSRQGAGALGRKLTSPRKLPLGRKFGRIPLNEDRQEETG